MLITSGEKCLQHTSPKNANELEPTVFSRDRKTQQAGELLEIDVERAGRVSLFKNVSKRQKNTTETI